MHESLGACVEHPWGVCGGCPVSGNAGPTSSIVHGFHVHSQFAGPVVTTNGHLLRGNPLAVHSSILTLTRAAYKSHGASFDYYRLLWLGVRPRSGLSRRGMAHLADVAEIVVFANDSAHAAGMPISGRDRLIVRCASRPPGCHNCHKPVAK